LFIVVSSTYHDICFVLAQDINMSCFDELLRTSCVPFPLRLSSGLTKSPRHYQPTKQNWLIFEKSLPWRALRVEDCYTKYKIFAVWSVCTVGLVLSC